MKEINLKVKIGDFEFQNPITVASGTFGYIEKYMDDAKLRKLGAIVPKTITLNPQDGNPAPRIVETASGMINSIGIENEGVDSFIENKLPKLQKIGIPIIVSISGKTKDEFLRIAEKLNKCDIAFLELNLSCPNLGHKKLVAQDSQATFDTIKAVKEVSKARIIAKLSPNVTDISEIALSAEEGKADALSLVNTFWAMAIDIKKRIPLIGNVTGGLSGPAIKPIALSMVYKVRQVTRIPIIAMGGIMDYKDALEFIIAGATFVAVGTANFINPNAPLEILKGIKEYLKENNISDINQLIGSLKTK